MPSQNTPFVGAICAGLPSSGSTWIFNVVKRLFVLKCDVRHTAAIYADDFTVTNEALVREAECLILKSHTPTPAIRSLSRLAKLPVVLSLREPKDAVASLMARFGMDFDIALEFVINSSFALMPLQNQCNVLVLRYEAGFTKDPDTIQIVARHIGVMLDEVERDTIFETLTPEAVSAAIVKMERQGSFADLPKFAAFDSETHWHPSHVGDLRTGKWPEQLTGTQAAMVGYATRLYCNAFDYKADPLSSGTDMRFCTGGVGLIYMDEGFCPPEPWGTWVGLPTARLRFKLSKPVKHSLRLNLLCLTGPSLQQGDHRSTVRIAVNGLLMTEIFSSSEIPSSLLLSLAIDGDAVADRDEIEIRFQGEGILSPFECGINVDNRKIGIGLISLRVDLDCSEACPLGPSDLKQLLTRA